MEIPVFLAMTEAELGERAALPERIAWMACHYSPYSTGLSHLPRNLGAGSMLIMNDRMPPAGHDPEVIAKSLAMAVENFQCDSVLLDFQRADYKENAEIARAASESLPCPVAVTELYAEKLACGVFLPPVPPHIPLSAYLAPWQGREIWLEIGWEGTEIAVTPQGSSFHPLTRYIPPDTAHVEKTLCCRYEILASNDLAQFRLGRRWEDLKKLLNQAQDLGVTRAVGLWQEMTQE